MLLRPQLPVVLRLMLVAVDWDLQDLLYVLIQYWLLLLSRRYWMG
jgi:uncharacterized membrane protein YjdF